MIKYPVGHYRSLHIQEAFDETPWTRSSHQFLGFFAAACSGQKKEQETVFITATPDPNVIVVTITPQPVTQCSPTNNLQVNNWIRVAHGNLVDIFVEHSLQARSLGKLYPGDQVMVRGEPFCTDSHIWYPVGNESETFGWVIVEDVSNPSPQWFELQ